MGDCPRLKKKQEALGHIAHLRKILHVFIAFYKLAIISPCRGAWLLFEKKYEFPLPKDALC